MVFLEGTASAVPRQSRSSALHYAFAVRDRVKEVIMKRRLIQIISFAVCACAALQANADKLYMKDGSVRSARSVKWVSSANQYMIEMDSGGVTMPVDKAKVDRVEVAKPPDYDKAVQLINSGNLNDAVPLFENIISGYQMLGWDNKSRDYLGMAYSKKKDFKKAAEVYKRLFATALPSEITSATQKRYWDALIATGDYASMQKEIDSAIAVGSRENAAMAQIARGDMYMKQGKKFEALMDYLRTVILYQKIDEVQPEALFKAAQCLEEMRDPRADTFKKKLSDDYPGSEWAAKLK
jgi:TolA-binding protein